jgi:hypothetical protein
MRRNQGSGAVALLIICTLIFLVYMERSGSKAYAEGNMTTEIDIPEYYNVKVSVESIHSTTQPMGWGMALVTVKEKKFNIFYDRTEERDLGWGTGPNKVKVTYTLTDESNPPGPNGYKPYSPFVIILSHHKDTSKLSGLEFLNEKTYSDESGLQYLIISNDSGVGTYIFEKIYRGLDKLQPPPPLSDE